MKKIIRCKICKYKTNNYKSLALHIRQSHNISSKEYYIKYIRKNNKCLNCGKPTKFKSLVFGFHKYCSIKCCNSDSTRKKEIEKTCVKKYGFKNPMQCKRIKEKALIKLNKVFSNKKEMEKIKKKRENTNLEKYNVTNVSKATFVREKIKKVLSSKEYNDKRKRNSINKWGVIHKNCLPYMKEHYHIVNSEQKMKEDVQNKCIKTSIVNWGVPYPSQNPIIHKKQTSSKGKNNHGYLSNSEYEFSKKLKKNKYKFKNEYFYNDKNWDFALFKNGKLNTLVEIDGEYFHSIFSDCDGKHSNGYNDYKRFSLLKNTKVKLVVIDSLKLDMGIKEVNKVYSLSYTKYIKRMIRQVSKLKLGYNFSKERMDKDYASLCFYKYNTRQSLGISIVRQFTDFNVKDLDIDKLIKEHTMYYSKCSSHNPLDFIKVTNPSNIRHKYLYDNRKVIKFKKYDIGTMLGVCSIGKQYECKNIKKEDLKTANLIASMQKINVKLNEIENKASINCTKEYAKVIANRYCLSRFLFA